MTQGWFPVDMKKRDSGLHSITVHRLQSYHGVGSYVYIYKRKRARRKRLAEERTKKTTTSVVQEQITGIVTDRQTYTHTQAEIGQLRIDNCRHET